MSDITKTIAFAYRRRGVTSMERSQLMSILSFDLRWFPPDLAKKLVTRAIGAGLIEQHGDELRVTFDPSTVDIPVNYRPREDTATDDAPVDMPSAKLAALAPPAPAAPPAPPAPNALSAPDAVIERERLGGLVSLEVAALICARRRGEDVRERAAEASRRLVGALPSR